MLVLSRKAGERIHIGEDITIEIRRIAGNRVAIAVQAPRETPILRGELKESASDFRGEAGGSFTLVVDEAELPTAVSA